MSSSSLINKKNSFNTRFLSEEEQDIYEDEIKRFSGRAYENLNFSINGSNSFKIIFLNQIGIKTADLFELQEEIFKGMKLRDTFEDAPSVVLRSNGDSYSRNDYLAKLLFKEVKKRTRKDIKNSLVLSGLKLKEDSNSYYGLILEPAEDFSYIEVSHFNYKNNERKFSRVDYRGLPILNGEGYRTIYTRADGLSRLFVDGNFDLITNSSHLEGLNGFSRIIVKDNKF